MKKTIICEDKKVVLDFKLYDFKAKGTDFWDFDFEVSYEIKEIGTYINIHFSSSFDEIIVCGNYNGMFDIVATPVFEEVRKDAKEILLNALLTIKKDKKYRLKYLRTEELIELYKEVVVFYEVKQPRKRR